MRGIFTSSDASVGGLSGVDVSSGCSVERFELAALVELTASLMR